MNGIDFLLDTNAVIYLLTGNLCMKPFLDYKFGVSIISNIELLSFPNISEKEEKIIKSFLNDCKIINISQHIVEKTIELRKEYKIKLPDSIIASTSIAECIPLITADKGFSKIKELKLELINPFGLDE